MSKSQNKLSDRGLTSLIIGPALIYIAVALTAGGFGGYIINDHLKQHLIDEATESVFEAKRTLADAIGQIRNLQLENTGLKKQLASVQADKEGLKQRIALVEERLSVKQTQLNSCEGKLKVCLGNLVETEQWNRELRTEINVNQRQFQNELQSLDSTYCSKNQQAVALELELRQQLLGSQEALLAYNEAMEFKGLRDILFTLFDEDNVKDAEVKMGFDARSKVLMDSSLGQRRSAFARVRKFSAYSNALAYFIWFVFLPILVFRIIWKYWLR